MGSALDLPFTYSNTGKQKHPNIIKDFGKGLSKTIKAGKNRDKAAMFGDLRSIGKRVTTGRHAEDFMMETKTSRADVIVLSATEDSQTAYDPIS